jgi:hypothetical protein
MIEKSLSRLQSRSEGIDAIEDRGSLWSYNNLSIIQSY